MTEDHYLLLASAGQFLFLVDGSASQVSYAKKIVTLTEYDTYKLTVTNNNNKTVQVDISFELRTYFAEEGETDYYTYILYSLIVVIAVEVVLLTILFRKTRKFKRPKPTVYGKKASKKSKSKKSKKVKKTTVKANEKIAFKKSKKEDDMAQKSPP